MKLIEGSRYGRHTLVFSFESVIKCCFVAIIALFLVLEGEKALAEIPTSQKSNFTYSSSDYTHHHACSPLPLESEATNEEESENDTKDETNKLSHSSATFASLDLRSVKLVFFQRKVASESRAGISLIILHHCWKSFLSEVS